MGDTPGMNIEALFQKRYLSRRLVVALIAFLFLGVFAYLLPVVVSAIRLVPEELVQTALTLGASRFQVIRTVLVPAALPEI